MKRFLTLPLLLLLLSCAGGGRQAYWQDAPRNEAMPVGQGYTSTIGPGDRLYIHVYTPMAEAAVPFNEETSGALPGAGGTLRGRLVDADGMVLFPLLGRVPAAGMEPAALARELERLLVEGGYLTDPVVTVSLMNFSVTVIGEVANPQQLHSDGNRLTLFEALALCGDITMDGQRGKVIVVRTTPQGQTLDTVNLTSRSFLDSPYYYLRQNDIVYVVPTPKKQRTAYRNEEWPRYIATGTEAVRFAYTTIYQWFISPTTRDFFR